MTIKFRGLVLDEFRWAYGSYVIEPGYYKVNGYDDLTKPVVRYYICDEDGVYQDVCPTTVCQYTGIKDKSGNEVYELDVVKIHRDTRYALSYDHIGVIKKYPGFFGITPLCPMHHYVKYMEVIGNIHENPELVKGG